LNILKHFNKLETKIKDFEGKPLSEHSKPVTIIPQIGTEKCDPSKLIWHFSELQTNFHNFYTKKALCFGYKISRNKISATKIFPLTLIYTNIISNRGTLLWCKTNFILQSKNHTSPHWSDLRL
jgi:hypothetical protein